VTSQKVAGDTILSETSPSKESPKVYQLFTDDKGRRCAEIAPEETIGIRALGITDVARIERNEHAYVVLDLPGSRGAIRIRDILIVWSKRNKKLFVRWKQFRTNQVRDGRTVFLDAASPISKAGRDAYEDVILTIYRQILKESEPV
jgi:hypothetical protein